MIDFDDPRNIGQQIAIAAAKAGISVSSICKQAGVNQAFVSMAKHKEPSTIRNIRKLHKALKTLSSSRESAGLEATES